MNMHKIGKKPKLNFEIEAVLNGKVKITPFSQLIEGPTVVSVYMRNNTSACDKQTCSLSKDLQVSSFSIFLSAYYLMLHVYSNQNDIIIGTTTANRQTQRI